MGRLFDAVAVLLGLADERESGAGAARKLEAAARSLSGSAYPFRFSARHRPAVVDFKPMYKEIAHDLERALPPGLIAACFHATVIEAGFKVASWIAARTGLKTVALSGGVFQNEILKAGLVKKLSAGGFRVLLPRAVPVTDANLALGQAAIGATALSLNRK
jgi:hydrogenase maturation protein HypF